MGTPARLVAAFLLLLLTGAAAGAATLSAEDKADVARVEAYLNDIKTLQSRFLQIATDGSSVEGTFSLDRPGKMRIDYEPPSPVLIVADGHYVVYFDKDLQQTTYLSYDDTPAGILLADKIALSGKVQVLGIDRRAGVLSVALANAKDQGEGRLTLVFSDKPLTLRKWIVTDPQSVTTTFTLLNPRQGVTLSPDLFKFQAPKTAPQRRD
jgi:outer membrane lipoprotein-sorting protein